MGRWRQSLEQGPEDDPPPGAGGGRECPVREPRRGVWPRPHLGFQLVASRSVRGQTPAVSKSPVCSYLLQWPQDTCTDWTCGQGRVAASE